MTDQARKMWRRIDHQRQALSDGGKMINENEFWNARREKLEEAVIKATLDLFEHMGSAAFKLPIKNTKPQLFIVAGDFK